MKVLSCNWLRQTARMGLAVISFCYLVRSADAAVAIKEKPVFTMREKPNNGPTPGTVVLFPAKGHIDLNQGTVEMVFSLAHSFGDTFTVSPDQSAAITAAFPMLYNASGRPYSFSYEAHTTPLFFLGAVHRLSSDDSLLFLYAGRLPKNEGNDYEGLRVGMNDAPIKENQWHHLAATWKFESKTCRYAMYFEGKKVKERVCAIEGNPKPSDTDLLGIGTLTYPQCNIQSLRISNRPRTDEEISAGKTAGLARDEATSYFLDAASIVKLKKASLQEINRASDNKKAALKVGRNGTVFGDFKIVPAPDGKKAIQFFSPK